MQTKQTIWQQDNLSLVQYQASKHQHLANVLAEMRINYFCKFPYLYQGSMELETHSHEFVTNDLARIILLHDQDNIGGIATHIPLPETGDFLCKPFTRAKLNPLNYLYYAEAIIKEEYRNKGISKLFQHAVEKRAKDLNIPFITAMTVYRTKNHPLWPNGYISFDNYMKKLNYTQISNLSLSITWPTVPDGKEQEHLLHYWQKQV